MVVHRNLDILYCNAIIKQMKQLTSSEMGKLGSFKKWKGKTKKERALIMAKVRAGKKSLRGKEK